MKSLRPFLPVLAALTTSLGAQVCIDYPSNTPATGTPDPRPFGDGNPASATYGNMRYQLQIPPSVLGNQPLEIVELFVAPEGSHMRTFSEFKVRFGHNPNPLGPQMVFNTVGFTATPVQIDDIALPTTANQWTPLGMASAFSYVPASGQLLVEFTVRAAGVAPGGSGGLGLRTDPSIPFAWTSGTGWNGTVVAGGGIKVRLCTDHYGVIEYGVGGCPGSNNLQPELTYTGSPQIGQTININVTNGPSSATSVAVLAFSFYPRAGAFDLSGLGATGCTAYVHDHVVLWQVVNGGSHTVSLPLAPGLAGGVPFWNQWFFFDTQANPLGLSGSNFGRFMVGN